MSSFGIPYCLDTGFCSFSRYFPNSLSLAQLHKEVDLKMSFVGFLRFAVKCFDVLAWPLCSLGYPLCASVSAIEANSSKDIQNLVTYWVSFSLISLFDHAFAKLLYWNPLWPYMKLLAICWLTMPHFDSSLYVYKHVVHRFVSETPELVMNWLNAWKEIFLPVEDFLVVAERYIEENGAEALEKLIAKKSKCAKPKFHIKDVKAVDAIEKNAELPECKEPCTAQNEIKKVEVTEKKEAAAAKPLFALVYPLCASIQAIESNSSSDILKLATYWVLFSIILLLEHTLVKLLEWIPFWPYMKLMVICWLVIPSFDGASFVYGRYVHRWISVSINRRKALLPEEHHDFQVHANSCIKDNGPESPKQSILNNSGETNCATTEIKVVKDSETTAAEQNNHAEPNPSLREINISSKEDKEMETRETQGESEFRNSLFPQVQKEWTCALCQVTTQSETTLNDHLRGKRHKTNMEAFSASMKGAKSKAAAVSSSTSKKTDQSNKAYLFTGQSKQNMKKTRVENQYGAIWCDKCEIWCSGAVSMVSHLTGKKHLERLQKISAGSSSGVESSSQLNSM